MTEAQGTVFFDTVTGFHARPRLLGDLVTVGVAPEPSSFGDGTPERARLWATVRGKPGEWIAVGGADARTDAHSIDVFSAHSAQRGVWLKVDADESPR